MNSKTGSRTTVALALLAAAIYALPLFFPPATMLSGNDGSGWLHQIMPTVPGWWTVGRLIALATCAVACAFVCDRRPLQAGVRIDGRSAVESPAPWQVWAALVAAAATAVAGFMAGSLDRFGQLAFVAALAVPSLCLLRANDLMGLRSSLYRRRADVLVPLLLAGLWLGWRLPAALHSPRSASIVDVWLNFDWVQRAAGEGQNLLTGSALPGMTYLHLVFAGIPLFPVGSAPSLEWIQLIHCAWTAFAGAAVFMLARCLMDRTAAAIAMAVFLFSPVSLFLPLCPYPFFGIAMALAGLLFLACGWVLRAPSAAGVVAVGALSGVAATIPSVAPFALIGMSVLAIVQWRSRTPAWISITAMLLFAAPIVAGWQAISAIPEMAARYLQRHSPWSELELILFGQISPFRIHDIWNSADVGTASIAGGALLSPFAIARTPLRLWGDTLFDPLGAVLAACGLAVCVRHWRTQPAGGALLALFLFALLPGVTSSYDRTALTRLVGLPILHSVFAGIGFTAISAYLPGARRATAGLFALVAVIAGGAALFDLVNPTVLRTSWLEIALESVRDSGPRRFLALDYPASAQKRGDWLNVERTARALPPAPLPTLRYSQDGAALNSADGGAAADVFLWSPALDSDFGVAARICATWPAARVYEIFDRAGLSYTLAAAIAGSWRPSLAERRWKEIECDRPEPSVE